MKFRDVKGQLAMFNVSIRRRDGEFIVLLMEHRGDSKEEVLSYYTDDLEDALLTGMIMRRNAREGGA